MRLEVCNINKYRYAWNDEICGKISKNGKITKLNAKEVKSSSNRRKVNQKIENIADIIGIADILSLEYRYCIDI